MTDIDLLNYLEDYLTEERKNKFIEVLNRRTRHFTLAIEDVYQLHNTSAAIRSCDVFGVQEAHVIEQRFGKRLDEKIAMGAQKWVDVIRHKNTTDCIDYLKGKGYKIIATTPHNDSCYLYDFDITEKAAFFFGTEKEGISDEVINSADGFLKIPMAGFSESLNVSVSVAIVLQYVTSKLRNSEIDWGLTEGEILEKRLDWAKKSIKSVSKIIERYKKDNL
ncbi:TrmH family RNA methyltransferase [Abyssalbus ytuae]|uniref:tRNA (guanosine(18)-2'-O)-methyltransferase n=1 Tax=Abyssalbus ytuae TaxID=2926907 RepID=A0A9E7A040_9FLAO|nr:RNA methyltransferase [Abyssalbus ytuae]UOB17166.1 RNA methyltransferase [Abyssalbus ytuae]